MLTQKITLKLPPSLAMEIETRTEELVERVKSERKPINGKPPLSQLEWATKTPEGKRFMQECMTHKYSKLNQRELNALMRVKYLETYGLKPTTRGRPRLMPTVTHAEARNTMLVQNLSEYFGIDAHTPPVKLVIDNS